MNKLIGTLRCWFIWEEFLCWLIFCGISNVLFFLSISAGLNPVYEQNPELDSHDNPSNHAHLHADHFDAVSLCGDRDGALRFFTPQP